MPFEEKQTVLKKERKKKRNATFIDCHAPCASNLLAFNKLYANINILYTKYRVISV